MKNKKKLMAFILVGIIFLTSGCGSDDYLKDDKNQIIINETTGQSVRKDILCQPSSESELYQIYLEHKDQMKKSVEELPKCEEFNLSTNEYNGLWEALLVRPLAWLIIQLGRILGNSGISVMLVGLLIRLLLLPLTVKSMRQSNNMQKAQPEIMRIEKKYAGKTDSESMMAKSQETMMIYQKYKINPVAGCLGALIQIPIFFAFLSAINEVPAIFEGNLFGMNLGMTPWKGLSQGEYIYIGLIFLIVATTYFSFKNTMKSNQNNEMMQQMNTMLIFMIVSISIASFSLPTAIALYWIVVNAFALFQNYLVKKILANDEKKSSKTIDIQERKKGKKNKKEVK